MTYTSRDRDRARRTVTAVTGLGAVGAFTATGWLAGMAAADYSSGQEATGTDTTAGTPAHRRVERQSGLRQRPSVTRITVRYVPGAARTPAAPAPAGPVTSVATTSSSGSSSSSAPSSSSGPSGSSDPGSSGSGSSGTPAAPSSGS